MRRVFGIETEYGITVDGVDNVDVVAESIALVRSYTRLARPAKDSALKWDYALEDPHQDARGFRVKELLQDTDESHYFEQDKKRKLSFQEIKSDLVLSNGSRFYNDHAHPEYSTPECASVFDLVAQDKAGERILERCALHRNREIENGVVKLYKNNTDFAGHSYGCHDNYLMSRAVPFERIVTGMIPFLVTRQIIAGTGKVGVEADHHAGNVEYQLSQRSDFFSVLVSIDTMNRRPIVNTRDEPHANPQKFRRLHVIIGDANMSQFATALKVGTTALVIELLERDYCPADLELARPIEATKSISRDETYRWVIELRNGRKISAIDVQRFYLARAQSAFAGRDTETDWLLKHWAKTLDDLERDPMLCTDRLDWVAKKYLLESFMDAEHVEWDDPWLKSLDLEYHDVRRKDGLFYEWEREGHMQRVVSEQAIRRALTRPPKNTRAYFRGRCVERFARQMSSVQWDEIVLGENGAESTISLLDVFDDEVVAHYNAAVDRAADVADLARRLGQTAAMV